MRTSLIAAFLALSVSTATAQTAGASSSEDALTMTRTLYAAASYAEALAAIERLKARPRAEERSELDRYEALCLYALGRATDAERVIETLVARDPLYRLDTIDAGPRVRATFSAVRRRVLPGVALSLYANGKRAYDRKAFSEAAAVLERALAVIADPAAESEGIDDLQLLAAGFLDLSRAAITFRPR